MTIQWGSRFITGITEVDMQHRTLIDLANRLKLAMLDGSVGRTIDAAFRELADYAERHFAVEERLMDEAGLDIEHASEHREAHARFVSNLDRLWAAESESDGGSPKHHHVLEFLTTWIHHHILITDHEMARKYHKKMRRPAPPSLALTEELALAA